MKRSSHEYKNSAIEWLGEVPKEWSISRLRFRLRLNPSKREVSHLPTDLEVSFIPMEAVGTDSHIDLSLTKQISEVENGYTYFRDNDVAYAKITPCFENGKGCIFVGLIGGFGFGTTELTVMRSESLLSKYLYYISISDLFRKLGEGWMYGAGGQKRVPDRFVKELRLPIPSDSEQITITNFLDSETARIDALIQKKERLIELVKEKRIALISQAATKGLDTNVPMKDSGIEWLGEVPEHWETKKLKYISTCNDQSLPETTDPSYEMCYVDISSVSRDEGISRKEEMVFEDAPSRARRIVRDGDTIVSTVRTYLRAIAAIINPEKNLIVSTGFAVIRPVNISSDYLSLIIMSHYTIETIVSRSAGVSYPAINASDIGDILIPKPPLEEQHKIIKKAQKVTEVLCEVQAKTEQSITLLHEYRSSLINAAVTGKIDLREAL